MYKSQNRESNKKDSQNKITLHCQQNRKRHQQTKKKNVKITTNNNTWLKPNKKETHLTLSHILHVQKIWSIEARSQYIEQQ